MKLSIKRTVRARALACCTAGALAVVTAGALATEVSVKVKVKLVKSSGACAAVTTAPARDPAVQVSCHAAGGLIPESGQVSYLRAGTVDARIGVVREPLPVYSDGTKITSWRVVQLDNAQYLELTITW